MQTYVRAHIDLSTSPLLKYGGRTGVWPKIWALGELTMYALRRKRASLMPAVALALLGAIVTIPALSSSRLYAAVPERFGTVTVQRGDSLGALAERPPPAGGSVQDTLDTIVAANHLDSATIVPGQQIKIPR